MLEDYMLYINTLFDEYLSSHVLYILKLLISHCNRNHYDLKITEDNREEALAEIEELKAQWLDTNKIY